MSAFTLERDGGVAIVTFDLPGEPVNKFSRSVIAEFDAVQVPGIHPCRRYGAQMRKAIHKGSPCREEPTRIPKGTRLGSTSVAIAACHRP